MYGQHYVNILLYYNAYNWRFSSPIRPLTVYLAVIRVPGVWVIYAASTTTDRSIIWRVRTVNPRWVSVRRNEFNTSCTRVFYKRGIYIWKVNLNYYSEFKCVFWKSDFYNDECLIGGSCVCWDDIQLYSSLDVKV